jgi:hypothetical protein
MFTHHYERGEQMKEFIELEPVELNDDELATVAGGFGEMTLNSTFINAFHNSGNISLTNSTIGDNSSVG